MIRNMIITFFAFIIGTSILVFASINLSKFEKTLQEPIVQNCVFTKGIIVAKRQYCAQDCKYTLVIKYEDKATEVNVSIEKYQFKMVGEEIDILTNCK